MNSTPILRASILFALSSCAADETAPLPAAAPTQTTVEMPPAEPAESAATETREASSIENATPPPEPFECEKSYVELRLDGATWRFEKGRILVPGKRGAPHAYLERLVHDGGQPRVIIEALGDKAKGAGSLTMDFLSGDAGPQLAKPVHIELMPPGPMSERRELITREAEVKFEEFGAEGEVVRGVILPTTVTASGRGGSGASHTLEGRFEVCRAKDWLSRGP